MNVNITRDELEALMERAAERGAKRALETVGLHDDEASQDVTQLRQLLDSYKTVKTSILSAIGKAIGVAILAALLLTLKMSLFVKPE